MKERLDPWYIQLPDGRVVKAKSTASVRHHVAAGHIPLNSKARRESHEDWQFLARIAAFADLSNRSAAAPHEVAPTALPSPNGSSPDVNLKSGISARLDPMRLQTVGIRGLVDELIAAFDSTVSSGKLVVACTASMIGSLVVYLVVRLVLLNAEGIWLAALLGGIAGLASIAVTVALLTRQTHLELSRMRPVLPSEARAGSGALAFRVFLGYVATIGIGVGLLTLLDRAPEWTAKSVAGTNPTVAEVLSTTAWGLDLVVAVGIFAMMLLSLLVPPILVVEECSVGDAIREWRALLREHRIRVMVYEGMAVTLALVAALPLLLPVELALIFGPQPAPVKNLIADSIPFVLRAVAFGPAMAFLAVANLFIYLNLRYEYTPNK